MRSFLFALLLLPAAAAFGQTAPTANPAPLAHLNRQFQINTLPQVSTLRPAQNLLAQNRVPLTLYAAPAGAKPQQIPTQWPNAKFELIPTEWPNARVVLIGGPGVKQGTPVPSSGGTLTVVPISASPQNLQKP